MADHTITFSAEDKSVLKKVRNVQQIGQDTAKLILSAPVLNLLSASSAAEFVATVTQADWDTIATGATNLVKVAACSAADILNHHIEVGSPLPQGEAKDYFEHLRDQLTTRCGG